MIMRSEYFLLLRGTSVCVCVCVCACSCVCVLYCLCVWLHSSHTWPHLTPPFFPSSSLLLFSFLLCHLMFDTLFEILLILTPPSLLHSMHLWLYEQAYVTVRFLEESDREEDGDEDKEEEDNDHDIDNPESCAAILLRYTIVTVTTSLPSIVQADAELTLEFFENLLEGLSVQHDSKSRTNTCHFNTKWIE
jgi:hypothetical protein